MNETGFCASYDKAYWVITVNSDKTFLLTNPENQEYIISVKSISDERKTIPLILILYNILILEK